MTKDTPTCFHCGSKLILISEKKQKLEGSTFARTVLVYRCSNLECQEQIDKQTAKRAQMQLEKEKMDLKRQQSKIKKVKV